MLPSKAGAIPLSGAPSLALVALLLVYGMKTRS
jgi:hypothetical protein